MFFKYTWFLSWRQGLCTNSTTRRKPRFSAVDIYYNDSAGKLHELVSCRAVRIVQQTLDKHTIQSTGVDICFDHLKRLCPTSFVKSTKVDICFNIQRYRSHRSIRPTRVGIYYYHSTAKSANSPITTLRP